ncbi:MAG: hypothetical protein ACRENI_10765 [Gemmatimonadaceae bacterium]
MTSNQSGNPMDAVASLMAERQRYEHWLIALENKRAITPPHVFERVRADYEARLHAVTEQLVGRTSELKQTVSTLTARLAQLQAEENKRRDERYEAELRAAVGEVTPAAWDDLVRSSDAEISRLGSERAGVTSELARLQQILSMSGGRAVAAGQDDDEAGRSGRSRRGERDDPAGSRESGMPAGRGTAGGGSGGDDQVERARRGNFDELAFLKSVVEPHGAGRGGDAGSRRDWGREGGSDAGSNDALAPGGGAASGDRARAADPGAEPRSGARPASRERARTPSPSPVPGKISEEAQRPAAEPGSVPSFLKDVPEEVKTLRCAECSAMNYPTEWYCERCGAELAAM